MQRIIPFIFLLLFVRCGTSNNKSIAPDTTVQTNNKAQILNNIVVHQAGGLEIFKAFVSYPNGTLINSKNIVRAGDTACLNLVVKEGWMAENSAVSLGAMQIIFDQNNNVVFSSPDLFAAEPKMDQAKASQVQLKTTLTKVIAGTQLFLVQYRVWDKAGPGEVKGYYRLQVSADAEN